jgi:hypothetical protein
MSALIDIIAVIAVIGYVITRQLAGQPLRGRRVILLPVILTVIGAVDLHSSSLQVRPADVGCLIVGGALVAGIGAGQARMLKLRSRNGYLWAQMPPEGLWLWLALIITRIAMTLVADGLDAKLAAATSTILLMLGINRLGQALVLVPRARSARIAFAPERNGRPFLPALTGTGNIADGRGLPVSQDGQPSPQPDWRRDRGQRHHHDRNCRRRGHDRRQHTPR